MILGQRLAEQVGKAPMLEEEMANANVGLDLIGEAQQVYSLVSDRQGQGCADDWVYQRDAEDFVNPILTEMPSTDFAHVMARQWLFDMWHQPLLAQLTQVGDQEVRAIANKAIKEATYHLERSGEWVNRLADSTDEAKRRLCDALNTLMPWCAELFVPVSNDPVDYSAIREFWEKSTSGLIDQFDLTVSLAPIVTKGGRFGVHSEHFSRLVTDMQSLARAHPEAQW